MIIAMFPRHAAPIVIALTVAAGCAGPQPLPLPGKERGDPREMPGSTSRASGEDRGRENGLAAKNVSGKMPPATLIANDGHRCVVPEPRYHDVQIGERVLCAWRRGDRSP